jgi:hypothetical protein
MDILGSLRVAIAIAAGLLRTTNRFPDVLVHLVLEFGAYLWEEHHTITVVGTDNQVVLVDGQCVGLIARVQAIAQDRNTIAGAKAFSVIHGIKVARVGKKKGFVKTSIALRVWGTSENSRVVSIFERVRNRRLALGIVLHTYWKPELTVPEWR